MSSYKKLDPEFKAKWVAALRSGEYKQGRSRLCHKGEYCCLGVAGIVAGNTVEELGSYGQFVQLRIHGITPLVPEILIGTSLDRLPARLMHLNDHGKSFAEIADWIEEKL